MMTWFAAILCEYLVLPVGVSVSPLTQMAAVTRVFGYSVDVTLRLEAAVSCCQLMVEVITVTKRCFNVWGLDCLTVSSSAVFLSLSLSLSLPREPCFLDNQVQASRHVDRSRFRLFLQLCTATPSGVMMLNEHIGMFFTD